MNTTKKNQFITYMFSSVFDLANIVSHMLNENCHNIDVANKNIKVFFSYF